HCRCTVFRPRPRPHFGAGQSPRSRRFTATGRDHRSTYCCHTPNLTQRQGPQWQSTTVVGIAKASGSYPDDPDAAIPPSIKNRLEILPLGGFNPLIRRDNSGAAGRIRTHDPLVRSQVLYPTELQPPKKRNYNINFFPCLENGQCVLV